MRLVTTPIFYVNGLPHIGHAFTAVVADAVTRWTNVRTTPSAAGLVTGTDEHGAKVAEAAEEAGMSPLALCDSVSAAFASMVDDVGCDRMDFVRTTEDRHKECVTRVWDALVASGHVYKGSYSGWYSLPDEAFLPASSVVKGSDGTMRSAESGHVLHHVEEENYMLRLSDLLPQVADHLSANPSWITPQAHRAPVEAMLRADIPDLAISRPAERGKWGIPVPNDPDHLIYVWIDALSNYLTAAEAHPELVWPPSVQVLGKDILKFHAVYWPALLLALGKELPDTLLVHSHWTVGGTKMSKSLGNVTTVDDLINRVGLDATRYFFLAENNLADDGDLSDVQLAMRTAELADVYANLALRSTSKALNPGNVLAPPTLDTAAFAKLGPESAALMASLASAPRTAVDAFDAHAFSRGLHTVFGLLRDGNRAMQALEPWALRKSDRAEDVVVAEDTISYALATVEIASLLLQHVMPHASSRFLDYLHVDDRRVDHAFVQDPLASVFGRERAPGLGDPDLTRKANASTLRLFSKLTI